MPSTTTQLIPRVLHARADAAPDAEFVRFGDTWISPEALDRRAERIAAGLYELGVRKGDRVAWIAGNRPEVVELVFACARLGAVQVPINAWLKGEFLRYQLADCQAGVVVADEPGCAAVRPLLEGTDVKFIVALDWPVEAPISVLSYGNLGVGAAAAPAVALDGRDVASIIYTSGTTGQPKGCLLSHAYYTTPAQLFMENGWLERGDRLFTAYPLFHTSGQIIVLMNALLAGGSAVFEPAFSASTFLRRAADAQATVLAGVGFMAMAMLAQPASDVEQDHGLRCGWWIPITTEARNAFERRFAIRVCSRAYGQTECLPVTMAHEPSSSGSTSSAPPARRVEVRLVDDAGDPVPAGDVGEIVVRPREPGAMFSGYWNRPEATVEAWRDLWHHTGDLGRADAAGNIEFVDRKKDALRRRGENVSSQEIEAVIARHPSISQVAVCAVPSDLTEDDIRACIVWEASGAPPTAGELFDFFRAQLPYYAVPRFVDVRDSLPANALGRIMKHKLRGEELPPGTWDFEALGFTVGKDERR